MKKNIYLPIILIINLFIGEVFSQCSNFGSQFPSATQSTTSNSLVNVSTCVYGGEWSAYNVTSGQTYTWTTCGDTDFDTQLTLWNTAHTISYAYNDDNCGLQSTITWTATFTGIVHVLLSRFNCANQSTCMTLQWACTSCGSAPGGCLNTSSYGSATAPTNTTPTTISTCNYQTEYSTISNIIAGNSYQFSNSCGGYITIRSGTYNGTVVASGNTPLTFTAPTSGTYYVHWNTNSSCGTATSCCTTTITCTSCGGATCNDGIQNQGETGIDCGGPCPVCPTGPNLIPTACSNINYNMTANTTITFYDDGGPGGDPCADAAVSTGNYCNCNCFTTVTICAATGQYIIADFREFAMWNTTSGWDWMRIYNGPNTGSPIMYDNSSTGANNSMGDCGIGSNVLNFCSSGQCMTFQFWATSVVNRAGWDALVSSVSSFCTPLPIELLSFTGEAIEETNVLNWTTTSEINNDFFIIEASIDAENFSSIGTIAGAGNSNEVLNYQFTDNNPKNKTMYYRLKQVDFDGKWENSEIVAIERVSLGTINIFPNPVNNMLHINFNNNDDTDYTIFVTNILGEVISETNTIGKSKLTLEIFNQLSGGVYFVKIMDESNNLVKTEKVIKH
ncbi:MAG: T9SS type A sorting domain-containing protein [Vicingaceae bacterium]|jgi:type IX secretion system substrate protein|nr:T9SS type A sorting domain-containing protein [Vicingaceae bacterium]